MRTSDQSGYALLFALWVLMILAGFSELFLIQARQAHRAAASVVQSVKTQLALDGAIAATIVGLLNPSRAATTSFDGQWAKLSLLDEDMAIRVTSESGKLDINQAPADVLGAVFRSVIGSGSDDPSASRELAAHVAAWRTIEAPAIMQAERNLYAAANRPYRPRFAPFRSPQELRLTLGMEEATFRRIEPLVTVWSGQGGIDLGVASNALLEALRSDGNGLAQTELDARLAGKKSEFRRPPQIGDAVEIEARYESEFVQMNRRAVIRLSGDRAHPYEVLSWR